MSAATSTFKARHATKTSMRNSRVSKVRDVAESNFLSGTHALMLGPVVDRPAARGQIGTADRRTGSQLRPAAERQAR